MKIYLVTFSIGETEYTETVRAESAKAAHEAVIAENGEKCTVQSVEFQKNAPAIGARVTR